MVTMMSVGRVQTFRVKDQRSCVVIKSPVDTNLANSKSVFESFTQDLIFDIIERKFFEN